VTAGSGVSTQRAKRRLALIGHNGMLAQAVRREAAADWSVAGFDLPMFDLTKREQVVAAMVAAAPDVIVNCAAYTDVDGCEEREDLALRVNGDGPGYLAEAARETGAILVHLSTDYVFDGTKESPYTEADAPAPRSAYGRSKWAGERAVQASGLEQFFIVRTSWLYGPGGVNFVETMVRLARERDELRVVADQVGSPTYTADLARAIFRLLDAHAPWGVYHFSNAGQCSWHGFAEAILAALGRREPVRAKFVRPIATADYPQRAPRPAYSVLSKDKYRAATGHPPPPWQEALGRYFTSRGT